MSYQVKGTITKILEPQKGTSKQGKEWIKGGFVIDTGEQYDNVIAFEIFGTEKLNEFAFKVGDLLDVFFNIKVNEWQGKYFTSLQYWRADNVGQSVAPPQQNLEPVNTGDDGQSDLPF